MTSTNKPKLIYWIIAIIALVWNAMGVMAYLAQAYITEDAKALLTEVQRKLHDNQPIWVTAAFAIAVFGGLLGSLSLIIKKKWAIMFFLLSFIGIIVQMANTFFISNAMETATVKEYFMPVMIIIFGLFLYMYSKKAKTNGWLN